MCRFALAALMGLAVASAPALAEPEVGKMAPAFDLPATNIKIALPDAPKDKKTLSLKDVKGKNVVLFFFPKALTRG